MIKLLSNLFDISLGLFLLAFILSPAAMIAYISFGIYHYLVH